MSWLIYVLYIIHIKMVIRKIAPAVIKSAKPRRPVFWAISNRETKALSPRRKPVFWAISNREAKIMRRK